jgi:hypothetical protein
LVGDIVFAQPTVRSDAKRGIVDKLQYAFKGPWRVSAILTGASYELEHCDSKQKEKKHASDLSPAYLVELIPFRPIDGADTRYGQLFKHISAHPFKEAGIKGFTPTQPYKIASNLAITGALHSIGPVSQSSMMNLRRSLGLMTTSFNDISTGIPVPSSLF